MENKIESTATGVKTIDEGQDRIIIDNVSDRFVEVNADSTARLYRNGAEASVKQDEDLAYRQAFHYIVGCLTTRERLGMPPLPVAQLYQQVYDSYGVLPVESVVKELKLEV